MEKLVLPERCVDKAEEALFKDYMNSVAKIGEINVAAEYMSTLNNPSMFPIEKKQRCDKLANRVDPIYTKNDYCEFANAFSVRQTITADLIEFDRYANFSESSLTATKIRESITAEINISTPSNYVKPKDDIQQFVAMKASRPT